MKIIYFGDPMCSWCWGITKPLEALVDHYSKNLEFELVLGGLRPGGGDEWNEQFKKMLRNHWEHVQEASKQPFNHDLFNLEQFNYDTEPACRAVRVIRDLSPKDEFQFFQQVQKSFYVDNKDPGNESIYEPICALLDINFGRFSDLYHSDNYRILTQKDFMKAQMMGIRGFPAVILELSGKYHAVTMGFAKYELMRETVEIILKQHDLK